MKIPKTPAVTNRDYLSLMIPWLRSLRRFTSVSPYDPRQIFYGTGESAHWAVQSNLNVSAALAVMSENLETDEFSPAISRDEVRETALAFLRYALRSHKSVAKLPATDANFWGQHWISVLGLERAAHGIRLLKPYMTDNDMEMYKTVMLSEAESILKNWDVVAGIPNSSGRNHPESNIWNGCFLYRTLSEFPHDVIRDVILDKADRLLTAGISHPSDETSEKEYRGRLVKDLWVGANFTENYSLDHHGYMNIGYSFISLSHVAMSWYGFRETSEPVPDPLFHNAENLWNIVRNFIFPDGRLLRLGGDTRARYTYCQCYALPVYIMAADKFKDGDAPAFESGWLQQVKTEMDYSGDGTCFSRRLFPLGRLSPFYLRRLESDHILSLSYGAYWRSIFNIPSEASVGTRNESFVWKDDFHGAACIRSHGVVRTHVCAGAQGPTSLCLPLNRSDMAEWQGNINLCVNGIAVGCSKIDSQTVAYKNGFLCTARYNLVETNTIGEGVSNYDIARVITAHAALPDGKTILSVQYAQMIKDTVVHSVFGLNLLVPNDVFNCFNRTITTSRGEIIPLNAEFRADGLIDTGAKSINIDGVVRVTTLNAEHTIKIARSSEQNVLFKRTYPCPASLYAERICSFADTEVRLRKFGEIITDEAFAVTAGISDTECCAYFSRINDDIAYAEIKAEDGFTYILAVNTGSNAASFLHNRSLDMLNDETRAQTHLSPGYASLMKRC